MISLLAVSVFAVVSAQTQKALYTDLNSGCAKQSDGTASCDNWSTLWGDRSTTWPFTNNKNGGYCNSGATLTAWQQYACSRTDVAPCCYSFKYSASACSNTAYNGIAILWHGFTASPDQYSFLAAQLQKNCFDVYVPTYPGHGRPVGYGSCSANAGSMCLNGTAATNNVGTTDVSGFPNSRIPYENHIATVHAAIIAERAAIAKARNIAVTAIKVASVGLSLGGAHSVMAPALWNVANPTTPLYTTLLSVDGFFGLSLLSLDQDMTTMDKCFSLNANNNPGLENCLATALTGNFGIGSSAAASIANATMWVHAHLYPISFNSGWQAVQSDLRVIMTGIVEGTYGLPSFIQSKLVAPTSWGGNCDQQQWLWGKGGVCYFTIMNLLACHSSGDFAITAARFLPKGMRIQFITSERDGITRNGLTVQAAANALSTSPKSASLCMNRMKQPSVSALSSIAVSAYGSCPNDANACGAPHSSFSHKDNWQPGGPSPITDPLNSYYDPGYVNGVRISPPTSTPATLKATQLNQKDFALGTSTTVTTSNPNAATGGSMWWEPALVSKSIAFLAGKLDDVSDVSDASGLWKGDGTECVGSAITAPPAAYYAKIPVTLLVTLENTIVNTALTTQETAAAASAALSSTVTAVTGAATKAVGFLTALFRRRELAAAGYANATDGLPLTDASGTNFAFTVDPVAAQTMYTLNGLGVLTPGNMKTLNGYKIKSIQILDQAPLTLGQNADGNNAAPTSTDTTVPITTFAGVVGALCVVVAVLVALLVRRKGLGASPQFGARV